MRTLFSDVFPWADGPLPTVSGAKWAKPTGWPLAPQVVGHLLGGAGGDSAAYLASWTGNRTAQWSSVVVTVEDPVAGPSVFNSSTGSFYVLYVNRDLYSLWRELSSVTYEQLTEWPAAIPTVPGDVFRLEVFVDNSKPVLTCFKNGISIGTFMDTDPIRLTAGVPGVNIYGGITCVSKFEAGDFQGEELLFLVGGVPRRPDKGSFRFSERLGTRNSGNIAFTAREPNSGWMRVSPKLHHLAAKDGSSPQHGQSLVVLRGGGAVHTTLFAGRLTQPQRSIPGKGFITYACTIQDFSEAFDRRLIAAEYENRPVGDIVKAIMVASLDEEGLTAEGVEDGPVVTRIVFGYVTVQAAFSELAKRTAFTFWVDYNRVVNFRARESKTAPVEISDANAFGFTVKESSEMYRNYQMIRGGKDITDVRTEEFYGDAKTRTFVVGFPVAKVPAVYEDRGSGFGPAKKIGIKGLDASGSADWYWNGGSAEIVQDDAGVILSATQAIRVVYQGEFPVVGQAAFPDEISTRAAIEGSSGRYEAVEDDASIDRGDIAIEKAVALLNHYGLMADVVTFQTSRGWSASRVSRADHAHAAGTRRVVHDRLGDMFSRKPVPTALYGHGDRWECDWVVAGILPSDCGIASLQRTDRGRTVAALALHRGPRGRT